MRMVSVILLALVLSTTGCADPESAHRSAQPDAADSGGFHLYLVNVSAANREVDMAVYIDQQLVLQQAVQRRPVGVIRQSGKIETEVPSAPKPVALHLNPGIHTIRAVAEGECTSEATTFTVADKPLWCLVMYDYSPGDSAEDAIPEHVVIQFSDGPPGWL